MGMYAQEGANHQKAVRAAPAVFPQALQDVVHLGGHGLGGRAVVVAVRGAGVGGLEIHQHGLQDQAVVLLPPEEHPPVPQERRRIPGLPEGPGQIVLDELKNARDVVLHDRQDIARRLSAPKEEGADQVARGGYLGPDLLEAPPAQGFQEGEEAGMPQGKEVHVGIVQGLHVYPPARR